MVRSDADGLSWFANAGAVRQEDGIRRVSVVPDSRDAQKGSGAEVFLSPTNRWQAASDACGESVAWESPKTEWAMWGVEDKKKGRWSE